MYIIYAHIIVLEMLLAVVELQQVPLLLLLMFVIVCRMKQFVAVFFLQLIPVFTFLCSSTI